MLAKSFVKAKIEKKNNVFIIIITYSYYFLYYYDEIEVCNTLQEAEHKLLEIRCAGHLQIIND